MLRLCAQGDILIELIDSAPVTGTPVTGQILHASDGGAAIVAEGEFTGHSHKLFGHFTLYRDATFSITLSIRNTSPSQPLAIRNIDLFDGAGERIARYLASPIAMRPLSSASLFLPVQSIANGSGPKFLIDWGSAEKISAPVIETVMLGQMGGMSISFTSRGVPIEPQAGSGDVAEGAR